MNQARKKMGFGGKVMLTLKGIIRGDKVILEDDNIQKYDGKKVVITILDAPSSQRKKEQINLDQFVKPSERGKNVEAYMEEMRGNGRQ